MTVGFNRIPLEFPQPLLRFVQMELGPESYDTRPWSRYEMYA